MLVNWEYPLRVVSGPSGLYHPNDRFRVHIGRSISLLPLFLPGFRRWQFRRGHRQQIRQPLPVLYLVFNQERVLCPGVSGDTYVLESSLYFS